MHPKELADAIAAKRNTTAIAHFLRDDGTLVVVLESGPKLIFSPADLQAEFPPTQAEAPAPAGTAKKDGQPRKKRR